MYRPSNIQELFAAFQTAAYVQINTVSGVIMKIEACGIYRREWKVTLSPGRDEESVETTFCG